MWCLDTVSHVQQTHVADTCDHMHVYIHKPITRAACAILCGLSCQDRGKAKTSCLVRQKLYVIRLN